MVRFNEIETLQPDSRGCQRFKTYTNAHVHEDEHSRKANALLLRGAADVSNDHSAFIFRFKHMFLGFLTPLRVRTLRSFETSETTNPVTEKTGVSATPPSNLAFHVHLNRRCKVAVRQRDVAMENTVQHGTRACDMTKQQTANSKQKLALHVQETTSDRVSTVTPQSQPGTPHTSSES